MRNIITILTFMFAVLVPGAGADNRFVETDNLIVGKPTTASPAIKFRNQTAQVRVNSTSKKLEFTNDGSIFQLLGSGSGGGGDGLNLLQLNGGNNDAEQGTTGWTSSGGTFTAYSSSPLAGLQSFQWTATALNQTLDSTAYATPFGANGRKCQVHLPYVNYSGATGDYSLTVVDGSGTVLATTPVVAMSGLTQTLFQAFDCPTPPTTMKVRILANVASPAALQFDDVFLGIGRRSINTFGAIVQAFVNSGPIAIGATTTAPTKGTVTNDTIGYARIGDHALIKFEYRQTAAGSGGSGDYLFTLPGGLSFDTSKVSFFTGVIGPNAFLTQVSLGSVIISDGAAQTTGAVIPFDATRFRIGGVFTLANGNGYGRGIVASNHFALAGTTMSYAGQFMAPIANWNAERAPVEGNTYDTSGWRVDALVSGTASPSVSTGVVPAGGLVDVPAASNFTIANIPGRGSVPALLACTAGQAPSSPCPGAAQLGIAFSIPQAQDVKVCVQFAQVQGLNGNGSQETFWKLYETSPTIPTTFIQGGRTTTTAYSSTVQANAQSTPMTLCENFTFSSAGLKTIRLSYFQPTSTGVNDARIYADGSNGRGIRWTAEPINQEMPAPVFTSIAQKLEASASGWRVESATLAANCAIQSQSGFLASTVQSGTNNAYCTLNFVAGKFSVAPTCVVTENQGGTPAFCNNDTPPTTTSVINTCWPQSGGPTALARSVVCMGPK